MAITADQYARLLARMQRLEEVMNDMIVASDNYITLLQVNQLLTIVQTELEDLKLQVEALEDRVTSIEEEPLD